MMSWKVLGHAAEYSFPEVDRFVVAFLTSYFSTFPIVFQFIYYFDLRCGVCLIELHFPF